jgi:MFS family permease
LTPTPPRTPRGNLFILAAFQFLRGAHNSIYSVVWQPFVLSLGASMPTLGLLNSIGGMGGIVTTVIQSLGGWLADRIGRKPVILVSSFAIIAGYALFAMAGALHIWTLLLIGIVVLGASWVSRPAISSITAESTHAQRQGSAFSLMQVAALVPGIVAPVFGGAVADRYGYVAIFPISIGLEAIVLVMVWRGLRETHAVDSSRATAREAWGALLGSLSPPPGLRGFFIATALDAFVWGTGWGLLYGLLSDAYHFSAEQLGLMSALMSLSWAVMQYPIGRWFIDRAHLKRMMLISEASGILLMLIYITQTQFEYFLAAQILFAFTAATWVPVLSTFLARSVGDAERAHVFGRIAAFRGIIGFPASAFGGWLYVWGGIRAPLITNLVGIFFILATIFFFVKEPPLAREA